MGELTFGRIDPIAGHAAAREMAEESWRRDYSNEPYLDLFDERYWSLNFRAPGAYGLGPIAWGVRDGEDLVGFAAGVPRRVRVRGRTLDTYLVGWLTVHARYRRRGVATMLYRGAYEELAPRHDGAFMFLDRGHASTLVFDRLERERPTHRLLTKSRVALRILDREVFGAATPLALHEQAYLWLRHRAFEPGHHPGVRAFRPDDLPACLALTRGLQADIVREWEEAELAHHLGATDVSATVVLEQGGRVEGFVNAIVVRQLGRAPCDMAFVEIVALGRLGTDDAVALLDGALVEARTRGCCAAIEFDRRYYPRAVLRGSGFFRTPRDLYLSYLIGREPLSGFEPRSYTLDWR